MPNFAEDCQGVAQVDEDEDIDFNPFSRGTPSPEPSSSLSSEIEGLSDAMDRMEDDFACEDAHMLSEYSSDSGDDEEEVLARNLVSDALLEIGSGGYGAAVEDATEGEFLDPGNASTPILDLDDKDAICRRTRARYSLANFTLDELENFLQETDDDEDLHIVDDEQEYKKFLTAVLLGGDNGDQIIQETENIDDDDEDNDADFDIEIEEALDSDLDENKGCKVGYGNYGGEKRRPVTRCQKASAKKIKMIGGQANSLVRPLVPIAPKMPIAPYPCLGLPKSIPGSSPQFPTSIQPGLVNSFTPHQLGQLHCLIHEHIQLLVQVFSLCVFDSSRQYIACEVQGMVSEMVHKRDELKPKRKVPYHDFCFSPPYIHPSVPDSNIDHLLRTKGSMWVPLVKGPVLSILDAAPLDLAGSYMDDVNKAREEHQQRSFKPMLDKHFNEKVSLFPLNNSSASSNRGNEVSSGSTPKYSSVVSQSLPQKSLAATIIESTKQSVAHAPKYVVKLFEKFYPLFNLALYPHKPPPITVSNRVLFTDAEDDLLAMGLMEFNTNWKAIKERYLPSKDKHQIFVRQKNRCSSKAPENSIKAVRRFKNSPLTEEEKARINEGLRMLKFDWMSIWRYIVPYRDPSLLPRQWRIALGTQKSYKIKSAAQREKRRLYESQRRKSKAGLPCSEIVSDKQDLVDNDRGEGSKSGDDNMGEENEAFVHEAFLADYTPRDARVTSSEQALSTAERRDLSQVVSLPQNRDMHQSIYSRHNSGSKASGSKAFKSPVYIRPYKSHKKKGHQLVQLAPNLPPVNLPPSVRVISQSAFKNYKGGSSQNDKVPDSRVETEDIVPRSTEKKKSAVIHSNVNIPPPHARSLLKLPAPKDKSPVSEIQMHPLLLQAQTNPTTFNFLPGNQLNTTFQFSKPPEGSPSAALKSISSKEKVTSSYDLNFHPLLQRTGVLDNDSVSRGYATEVPSEPLDESNSSYEQEEAEMDLEIHLSSTHSRDMTEGNSNGPNFHLYDRNTLKKSRIYSSMSHGSVGNRPISPLQACAGERNYSFIDSRTVLVRRDINGYTKGDNVDNDSFQPIVMEHEELSDSEEDIEEPVEFEREEMFDSEGEEPEYQHLVNLKHKELPSTFEKGTLISNDEKCQSELNGKAKKRIRGSRSNAKGKDIMEPNKDTNRTNGESAIKKRPSRPSRSCKKSVPNILSKKPRKHVNRASFRATLTDTLAVSQPEDVPSQLDKMINLNLLPDQCHTQPLHVPEEAVETRLLL